MSKFQDNYRLRPSDYTSNDKLAPHAILDITQDIAGKHAESFNMGYQKLIDNNQIWVLLRVKCKITHDLPLYANVRCVTWPLNKGLVDFDREYEIYDENNTKICNVASKWLILNSNTRTIIPAKKIEYDVECFNETNFVEKFDKIKDFQIDENNVYEYTVGYCDTDHNGHTNNVKYSIMALNATRPFIDSELDEFQIDFIHETHLGDTIKIGFIKEDNIYHIKGFMDGKTIFLMELKTK